MTAASIRARVRAELIEEIKAAARRHLATDGANLSLRAVARDLGMVSSALYRYFASRDDLLTALIVDAYNALGEAVEAAEGAVPRRDLRGRWLAACHAVRQWAVDNPHEYALIYGSPVPGYRAPTDTVAPASRPTLVLAGILADVPAEGDGDEVPSALRDDLVRLRSFGFPAIAPDLFARGLTAWIQLFGFVGFEVFGRLDGYITDRDAFFELEMNRMAELVGV